MVEAGSPMTDQTPATEAGRDMLALIDPHWVGSILAIEAEAVASVYVTNRASYLMGRADALREAAERVRASLPRLPYIDVKRRRYVERVAVEAAVLAILQPDTASET